MRIALLALTLCLAAGPGYASDRAPRRPVTQPRVLKIVQPAYTPEARAARVEGTVLLDVIVQADGHVGDEVKIVRSLDTKYGLDEQAIAAAKQWLFAPAKQDGKPIAMHVTIEQTFRLN
jgi:protein TonB